MLLLDLITKSLSFNGTFDGIPILGNRVKNPGITFGITCEGINIPVIIIGCILIIGLVYFRYKNSNLQIDIITALLIGGALGNLYDRIRLGYVRDFIQWPTFNLADVFICVGVAYFIVDSIYRKEERSETGGENQPADK